MPGEHIDTVSRKTLTLLGPSQLIKFSVLAQGHWVHVRVYFEVRWPTSTFFFYESLPVGI